MQGIIRNVLRIIVHEREGNDAKLDGKGAKWLYSFNTVLVPGKISDIAMVLWKRLENQLEL